MTTFSRLLTFCLLTHLVEFFQSDIVEPTHYTGLLSRSVKVFSRPYEGEKHGPYKYRYYRKSNGTLTSEYIDNE